MSQYPPFAALRAFDAAARHLSFRLAADELGVTPTAVSHQIKQLEALAGRALFLRRNRSVRLTEEGVRFAEAVRPALTSLATAFEQLSANPLRKSVTLGAGPIFASRHLVPRLAEFWSAHPDIDLKLHHSPLPVWQQIDQFDLAVAWGKGDWRGLSSDPLLRIDLSPVLAPRWDGNVNPVTEPRDLLEFPLLHHRNTEGWRQWFEASGVTLPNDLPGTTIEDSNIILHAALEGRGVALGVLPFIADDLASGRLLQPFELSIEPDDAYFLIYRPDALDNPAVEAVRHWLTVSGDA